MLFYVRPSNEALLRARVPGAQDQRGYPSKHSYRARSASKKDNQAAPRLFPPSLLAVSSSGWADWSPTARVQRGPSQAARCASKGD